MAVPKYHEFMKPLLERLADGREHKPVIPPFSFPAAWSDSRTAASTSSGTSTPHWRKPSD